MASRHGFVSVTASEAGKAAITQRGQHFSMLTEAELAAWYQRLNLGESTRTIIDQVRHSDPARRVGGGRSNVSGFLPQPKNGCDHPV